jgi:iron-sulfur cluster repair protein YtfE (RIC family)
MEGCMSAFGGIPAADLSAGLEQLKGEHPSLLKKLEELKSLTEQIEKSYNTEQAFAELKTNVENFKAELDPHSEREEGVLFPMMGKYIGTVSGPIAVMEYEHEQAKSSIQTFLTKTETDQLSMDEMKYLAGFVTNAYNILTEHFSKEENILFPMAEKMLSEKEKEELYNRINEIK